MVIGIDIRPLIERQLTGVGYYIYETLVNLFELDRQNQYKLFYNSFKIPPSVLVEHLAKFNNVELRVFKKPSKILNFGLVFFNRPYLDKLIGGCDLFWFPNLNFWSVSPGCRTIINVHDLSFKKLPWVCSGKMRLWHHLVRPEQKIRQAEKIFTISQNTKNDLITSYGLPVAKIEAVYPGPVAGPFSAIPTEPLPLPANYLLYIGTLEPRKNIEGVIQAFALLERADLHLVIAGARGWLYKKIYSLARQTKVSERIIFLNYVSHASRQYLYQNARALVWPSFYEGFGFPPLEAMACGCPVITSANSSIPEAAGRAALLVDPYNVNEIKEAISLIISDDRLRESLVHQGYEQVKKFSWSKSAGEIKQIFDQLKPA
ncbi:TPA: hypothetical protein DCL28_00265 [Candidatus Komeilibacteria bacterium]|nr:MAG: hypothetical protein UW91_C0019G0012 [Parcubacteria group bacterium GW2011_GWF2_45_11]KKT97183.1 MAG: hypothetical protein UW98_C0022G0024 [Parcubacteria group bacterium GW2011_GWC2_45_15]OGY92759.1 MAG: hypothetical protein A2260_04545 [Candidatus Komeilibacteria bacterium RIFOXYA2_FULL_45_9]OGY96328.1 MAG: hypothetical protein A3J95_04570 [Candidatus Komeilibacteria bacterium RIFOXYC2_FULL_45_12]HAH03980.1 hypothetical protein [Candidatus Komeilibacteria bacterium]